jgi:hypothetical protein
MSTYRSALNFVYGLTELNWGVFVWIHRRRWYFELLRHVTFWLYVHISEDHSAIIFRVEDECTMFLRNVGKQPEWYTAQQL